MTAPRLLPVALLLSLIGLGLGAAVSTHDLWIEPSSAANAGDLVTFDVRVGHGGEAQRVSRNSARIVRLEAVGPADAREQTVGVEGSRPIGVLRPPVEGTWILIYESHPAPHRLEAERFAGYLEEEGLDHIAELRRQRGQLDEPGLELFSRSVKSLLAVGVTELQDRIVGLPVELIATSISPDEVELQLIAEGRPSANALVDVRRLDQAEPSASGRTDAAGKVTLPIGPGRWLAATVHAREEPSDDADWRSFFSTLTFELAAAE